MMKHRLLAAVGAAALLTSCGADDAPEPSGAPTTNLDAAATVITPATIAAHIERLASDEMEGRGPGTTGAELAREYIITKLRTYGAMPGNHGEWTQRLPMRQITGLSSSLSFTRDGKTWEPQNGEDYVLGSLRGRGKHEQRGVEVVFVGYGVQAPEYGWDDYKGLDCEDKLLVMLVGDPDTEDRTLFGGDAMTYYGRWTYKYEKARELGAAGCLVVHQTEWAGYGWPVVFNSWGRPRMDLLGGGDDRPYGFRGWLSWDATASLVAATDTTLDELVTAARSRDFHPVPLGCRADLVVENEEETLDDINVAGVFEGSDPEVKDEWIIFTAHYDHLGVDEDARAKGEDGIYNGAIDNASGCAAVLAMAEAWGALTPRPRRSAMFLFVGSEEKGLLGSRYYSEHPIVPPQKTLANINIDGINVREKTTDVEVVGSGQSDLEDLLKRVLAADGRRIAPDSESEKGYYYRSDHFNFARIGVPALYIKGGKIVPGKADDYMREQNDAWRRDQYHRPSDEFDASWPLTGGAADVAALLRVGHAVAEGDAWPQWKESSEFRAVRERSLEQ